MVAIDVQSCAVPPGVKRQMPCPKMSVTYMAPVAESSPKPSAATMPSEPGTTNVCLPFGVTFSTPAAPEGGGPNDPGSAT